MSLQDKISDFSKFDNDLLIQIDRMAVAAYNQQTGQPLNQVLPFNPVDEELIAEYKSQFGNQPTYELDKPDLEEPELNYYASKEDEIGLQEDKKNIINDIERLNRSLKNIINKRKKYVDDINEENIITTEETYINELKKFDNNISVIKKSIERKNDEYYKYDSLAKILQIQNEDNNAQIKITEQKNNEKINRYKEELKILHNRNFTQDQLPSETQEEYLNRIKQDAEVLDNTEILEDSKRYNLTKFKNNIKELIRNPVIIEQVANHIDIEEKLYINKTFPKFKKLFVEIYGINNSLVTFTDILQFIEEYLSSNDNKTTLKQSESSVKKQNIINTDYGLNVEKIKDYLIITGEQYIPLFLRIIQDEQHFILLFSFTNEKGSYKQWIETKSNLTSDERKSSDEIFNQTGISFDAIKAKFGGTFINTIARNIIKKYQLPVLLPENIIFSQKKQGKNRVIRYGAGVEPENIPEQIQFGKVILMLHKLYYKNILSVKTTNKTNILGFKNTHVSERFVKIIMNSIDGIYPTSQEINILPNNEKQLYDQLIYLAQLHKKIPINSNKTVEELKKRMNLIEGEINAGNNSPLLYNELYQICHSLHNLNVLDNRDMKSYLKQFK